MLPGYNHPCSKPGGSYSTHNSSNQNYMSTFACTKVPLTFKPPSNHHNFSIKDSPPWFILFILFIESSSSLSSTETRTKPRGRGETIKEPPAPGIMNRIVGGAADRFACNRKENKIKRVLNGAIIRGSGEGAEKRTP